MLKHRVLAKKAGFTLLEVLVVLLIASIVLLIMGILAKSTFDVLRAGESRSQLTRSATVAIEYLARDIESATAIPLMNDRDLNGIPDDDVNAGYDMDATWVIGYRSGSNYYLPVNFYFSEAWADHLKTLHSSLYRVSLDGGVISEEISPPKNIKIQTGRVAYYTSYFRLAIPTSAEKGQPYYLSTYPFNNTFLNWYPETVTVGYREETAVLTQDISIAYRAYTQTGSPNPGAKLPPGGLSFHTFYNQPIGTNITRIRFEYFHEVPVYKADAQGNVAYKNLETGEVFFEDAPSWDTGSIKQVVSNSVPIIDHYELRQVDVVDNYADDGDSVGSGSTFYDIQDQYTQGFFEGAIRRNPIYQGIAWGDADEYKNWNIGFYWHIPLSDPDNAPPDFYAYTTDGDFRAIRYDVAYLIGTDNSAPTGVDFGNADGIPDGDGIPDDPVPGFWLPYLRAVRITIVATPTSVIKKRLNLSGKERGGRVVYYNIDSPVPYADMNRTIPLTTAKDLYVGEGKDIVISRMVYLKKTFKLRPAIDPADARLNGVRRADWNFFRGSEFAYIDPLDPDKTVGPMTPYEKYLEKELR